MRTNRAALNSVMAVIQRVMDTVLSFIHRTIFIYIIGITYLGVNGLFNNIFSVLSLAELGIGSTMIFLLYEPLSKSNKEEIKSIMKIFSTTYKIIGVIIFVVGLCLIPFFPYIINNNGVEIPNLNLIYILILLNSSSGYFFASKRWLLDADQKGYLSNLNVSIFGIINSIAKILILIISKNYVLSLLASLIVTVLSNIAITIKANQIYPYLKEKEVLKLSKDKKNTMIRRVRAGFMHNFSNIVLTSTDNIIISKYININSVGIYSNYTLITNTLYGIFTMIFTSITSSVGSMKITETEEKSEMIFNRLLLANFYFYFITCVVLYVCITPFIKIWLGDDYLLGYFTTVVIIFNLYISGLRHVPVLFINASGLNYNTRYKAVIEAILNLIVSLIAVKYLGIFGVLLGTSISLISCSVIIEPIVLYKHWFKKPVFKYFIKYISYLLLTILVSFWLGCFLNFIKKVSIITLFVKAIISFCVANVIFIIIFGHTEDFKFYINYFKDFYNKIKNKVLKRAVK